MKTQTLNIIGFFIVVIMIAFASCSKKDVQIPATKKTYFVRVASVNKDTVYSAIIKVK